MQTVHVQYGLSERAQAQLAFAADLARDLRATLFVWTHGDADAAALLKRRTGVDVEAQQETHIRDRVRLALCRVGHGLPATELTLRFARGDAAENVRDTASVLVGDPDSRPTAGAASFWPNGQKTLRARGPGEICLPFSNGDSAMDGIAQTLGLAARLALPVLFYHTTWRKDGLPDTAEPEAHMVDGARDVRRALEAAAATAGVDHRTVVETATSIVEGVCRAALNERCTLIALTRSRYVGRGSYVDDIVARTTVPVFVTGRSA